MTLVKVRVMPSNPNAFVSLTEIEGDVHKQAKAFRFDTLLGTFIAMTVGLAAYEGAKQLLFPHITLWQSHAITVVTFATASTLAVYLALRRRLALLHQAQTRLVERAGAEAALRASESRYRLLFETNVAATIRNTLDGRITDCNAAAARILGYESPQEMLGLSMKDIHWNPETRPEWMSRLLIEKHIAGAEAKLRHKDGGPIWVMLNVSLTVSDESGETLIQGTLIDITKRKQAEEALRASEKQFRQLADTIREVFIICTPEPLRVDYLSPAYEEIWGRTCEEIYERPAAWIESIHEEDRQRAISVYARSQEGFPTDMEYRIIRPDGTLRWIRSRTFPVADNQGGLVRVVAIAEDITERKQTQQALLRSEEKYRSLVANIPDVIWTMDENLRVEFISESIQRISGFTMDEIQETGARVYLESIHPDDVARVKEGFEALFATGEPFDVECRVRRKNGEWIWVHDRALTTYERNGIRYADGVLSDITERKRVEEALRESNTRFRRLIESNIIGVFVGDGSGQIVDANAAFLQMLGYTEEDLRARLMRWDQMTPPEFQHVNRQIGQQLRASGASTAVETAYLHKDGSQFPALVGLARLDDATDRAIGFVVDLTERKRAERELHAAKEMAEAASRAKSEFLANMSHEIRTPMNGILGMTELALDTPLNPEQRDYLTMVKDSADSLLTLINDILDFSKIDAGKLTLDNAEFNLKDVLATSLRLLSVRASKKGLETVWSANAGIPERVIGDAGRFRQVIVNLVGNAIKFTERAEIVLSLEVESRREDEMWYMSPCGTPESASLRNIRSLFLKRLYRLIAQPPGNMAGRDSD